MTVFRYKDAILPNTLLCVYSIAIIALIFILLPTANFVVWCVATLLLVHWLVLVAYFVHELMHGTVFKSQQWNKRLGAILCWLLGAGYSRYDDLKDKHLRHHTERMDVLALDYQVFLQQHPLLKRCVMALHKAYLPGLEWLSRILGMMSPFFIDAKKTQRGRVVLVLLSRLVFFAALAAIGWSVLLAYWVANLLCMLVLGFMDCYQHTFEVKLSLTDKRSAPTLSRDYEELHTYTNLVSARWPLFNLLVLNFCYHNVHHWRSGEPWYRLPQLHAERYPQGTEQVVPLTEQVGNYVRYRVERILPASETQQIPTEKLGATGVSFLVGV